MLPIILPLDHCKQLHGLAMKREEMEVDLDKQEIRLSDGSTIPFTVDGFARHCLLNGLDDIGLTLQKADAISKFESKRSSTWPWLDGAGYERKVELQVPPATKMDW